MRFSAFGQTNCRECVWWWSLLLLARSATSSQRIDPFDTIIVPTVVNVPSIARHTLFTLDDDSVPFRRYRATHSFNGGDEHVSCLHAPLTLTMSPPSALLLFHHFFFFPLFFWYRWHLHRRHPLLFSTFNSPFQFSVLPRIQMNGAPKTKRERGATSNQTIGQEKKEEKSHKYNPKKKEREREI